MSVLTDKHSQQCPAAAVTRAAKRRDRARSKNVCCFSLPFVVAVITGVGGSRRTLNTVVDRPRRRARSFLFSTHVIYYNKIIICLIIDEKFGKKTTISRDTVQTRDETEKNSNYNNEKKKSNDNNNYYNFTLKYNNYY